jgi:hypothetical protein
MKVFRSLAGKIRKGFTLAEMSVSIGLFMIVAGFLLISLGWIRHNMSILQKAALNSTLKYVHNIMNNEILLSTEIIVPPVSAAGSTVYTSHILYRNERNELVGVFRDPHGYLVMYNHSLDQFRDLMPLTRDFRVCRHSRNLLEYEFAVQQEEYGYSYRNALRLANVLP